MENLSSYSESWVHFQSYSKSITKFSNNLSFHPESTRGSEINSGTYIEDVFELFYDEEWDLTHSWVPWRFFEQMFHKTFEDYKNKKIPKVKIQSFLTMYDTWG